MQIRKDPASTESTLPVECVDRPSGVLDRNATRRILETRVLVVDDDPAFGRLSLGVLEQAGFRARFHRGPFGSLSAIREARPNVILLDVNMPQLDGGHLARIIQKTFRTPEIRLVLCSNMDARSLDQIAASLRMRGAIPKTAFESGDLRAIVSALLPSPV
ncbi:response regulator [Polyangium aurulentum]|uniref:response regulator n=1 Tax=Polyangium aurulentum TaxID=2567896 RepID=UPI0010AE6A30|nr:response regulator [Polyangium aurulentum]UQA59452.1 response regulator [Polyangium aurulentum]